VSRYQNGKTNLDFTEAGDSEWQWHPLGHMQVCISLQTDNHASTPPLESFFTGRMPFLPPNQLLPAEPTAARPTACSYSSKMGQTLDRRTNTTALTMPHAMRTVSVIRKAEYTLMASPE